jgi:hypothetical protein
MDFRSDRASACLTESTMDVRDFDRLDALQPLT